MMVENLCYNLSAASVLYLSQVMEIPIETIKDKIEQITSPSQELTLEIKTIINKAITSGEYDYLMLFNSIKNLIYELGSDKYEDVFETIMASFYDALIIVNDMLSNNDNNNEDARTEIIFPEKFMEFIENCLKFEYEIVTNIPESKFSKFSSRVHSILVNYLLQPDQPSIEKRYEGKIYSYLSIDNEWRSVILSRINNLLSDKLKENKPYLLLFLRHLKCIKKAQQKQVDDLVALTQKLSDTEIQQELILFISRTLKLSDNVTVESKFFTFCYKLCKKMVSYKMLKAVFIIISKCSSLKQPKIDKLIKSFSKIDPIKMSKIMIYSYKLICPKIAKPSEFLKGVNSLLFKKGKLPIYQEIYLPIYQNISDFYSIVANDEPDCVISLLKLIAQSIPQLSGQHSTLTFFLKMINKLSSVLPKEINEIVSIVIPYVDKIFSSKASYLFLIESMSFIPLLWCNFPDIHPMIFQFINEVIGACDIDVSIASLYGYAELLKKSDTTELPIALTLSIPINMATRITYQLPHNEVIRVIKALTHYLTVMKDTSNCKVHEDIDQIILTIESSLFPFIFVKSKEMQTSLKKLYSLFFDLTDTYFLGFYFFEEKSKSLSSCILKNEVWFIDVFIQSADYWINMNRFNDIGYTNALLEALFIFARDERLGVKIPITEKFFTNALDYMYRWKSDDIKHYIQLIDFSAWNSLFNAYLKIEQKYNGQPEQYFLNIQNAIITHRKYKNYNGDIDIFANTFTKYVNKKRLRFEKDIPTELMGLNISSSYIRIHQDKVKEISPPNIVELLMKKVDPKEIFVVDELFLFANMDLFAGILNIYQIPDDDIQNVINYIIKFSEKVDENSPLQYTIFECISTLFRSNVKSRPLIIQGALSSKRYNILVDSILNSDVEFSRSDLIQLFVLGMSIFNNNPKIGIKVAKLLLGEKIEINPFSQYNIETEDFIWEQVEKGLSDDEVYTYMEFLEKSINSIQKRQTLYLFDYFEKNQEIIDIESSLTLFASCYNTGTNLLPLVKIIKAIFQNNDDLIVKLLDFIFKDDQNYNSTSFLSHIAFGFYPEKVSSFLKSKLGFLAINHPQNLWESFTNQKEISAISSLSVIFALDPNSIHYFNDILPQIVLYALYLQDDGLLHNKGLPLLLNSLIYQFDPTETNLTAEHLNSENCVKAYKLLKNYSKEKALQFEVLCISPNITSINFYLIKSISHLFEPLSFRPLIYIAINFAKVDNVNNFIKVLPSILSRLNELYDEKKSLNFFKILLSFIYENGDPRIMNSIASKLSLLTGENCKIKGIDNGEIFTVALSSLLLCESVKDELYSATVEFLKYMSYLSTDKNTIYAAYIILDGIKQLSGTRIKCPTSQQMLIKQMKELIESKQINSLLMFLLRLASLSIIKEYDFRTNIVLFILTLFAKMDKFVFEDQENVVSFLLLCSICNDDGLSKKYSRLLTKFIEMNDFVCFFNLLDYFGPTLTLCNETTNEKLVVLSPEYCKVSKYKSEPNSLLEQIEKFEAL